MTTTSLTATPATSRVSTEPSAVLAELRAAGSFDPAHLRALSDPSAELLGQCLELWPDLEAERRREVLAAMQQLADEDATLDFHRVHLTALRDPDPATRMLAIKGLWEEERPEYMRVIAAQLRDDPSAAVRSELAAALASYVIGMEFGLMSDADAELLTATLRDVVEDIEEPDEVRGQALEALGASSEEATSELISEMYELGNHRMRVAALRAMGRSASDGWLDLLIFHFDDEDAEVRAVAAESAGELLLDAAVAPLAMLATEDTDEDVQRAAIGALGEIANEESERILTRLLEERSEPHVVEAARDALAQVHLMTMEPKDEPERDPMFDD
jgi:HEAT repeat protein